MTNLESIIKKINEMGKVNNLKELREIVRETPILFTFRTAKEGGNISISDEDRVEFGGKLRIVEKVRGSKKAISQRADKRQAHPSVLRQKAGGGCENLCR